MKIDLTKPADDLGPQTSGTSRPPRRRRRLLRFVLWLLFFSFLLSTLYLLRSPLLHSAADAWIVNDAPQKADAIVVLGGGMDTRPFEAARLYHLGIAPTILVMKDRPHPATSLGLAPTEAELTREMLLKKDIPEAALVVVGDGVASTYDESIAVRDWAKANGSKRVIVVTDLFHTRRAGWLFRKQLKPVGAQVSVAAVPVHEYTPADWWQHEQGLIAFQNEVLKFVYYWLKY